MRVLYVANQEISLHTLQVIFSFSSSVIDEWYLKTGLDKSPSSFATFFRKDITFFTAKGYSDEVCGLTLSMVNKLETAAVESIVGTTGSEGE